MTRREDVTKRHGRAKTRRRPGHLVSALPLSLVTPANALLVLAALVVTALVGGDVLRMLHAWRGADPRAAVGGFAAGLVRISLLPARAEPLGHEEPAAVME